MTIAFCACPRGEMFVPTRAGQKYATRACRQRHYRDRRSTDRISDRQIDLLTQCIRVAYEAQMRNRRVTHARRNP